MFNSKFFFGDRGDSYGENQTLMEPHYVGFFQMILNFVPIIAGYGIKEIPILLKTKFHHEHQ